MEYRIVQAIYKPYKKTKEMIGYLINILKGRIYSVQTSYGAIKFYCPSYMCYYRGRSFHYKEPETLLWIDSMHEGEVLWDIGANVGVYSLYAAKKGIKVYAFEPSFYNSHVLNINVQKNRMENQIYTFPFALSDESMASMIEIGEEHYGGAYNSVVDSTENINKCVKHAVLCLTIDHLCTFSNVEVPSHIKIDVDGIESRIIKGADKTLTNSNLRSVMIEFDSRNEDQFNEISDIMTLHGFIKENPWDNARSGVVYNQLFLKRD